jgi:hypothetical protein
VPRRSSYVSLVVGGGGGRLPFDYHQAVPIWKIRWRIGLLAGGRWHCRRRWRHRSFAGHAGAGDSARGSRLETLASQLLLHGNAYVQICKDGMGYPVELFALRPERVTLVFGHDGWPTGITYRVGIGR